MGASKKNKAEKIKEDKKTLAMAKLNNCPTSPRKMRLVADLVRGENIYTALNILRYNPKHASKNLEKLTTLVKINLLLLVVLLQIKI